jgi:single-stranded-DNA-specific exonuclease
MVRGAVRQITLSDEADARIRIDAELPSGYMTPDLWELVDFFEPYGQEYPSLVFLLRGAKIDRLDFMGKATQNHVRLLIDTGKYKWPAVYWNAADRVETQFSPTEPVDLVFELGRNYFQNRENLQLVLLDVRPTGVEVRSE